MIRRVLRSAIAVAPAALLVVGCMGGTVTPSQPSPGGTVGNGNKPAGAPHLMLTRSGDRRTGTVSTDVVPAAANAKLVYNGGPVLQNVKVFGVWWGSGVQFTDKLPGFYNSVTQSSYYDWLSEYDTTSPVQNIGEGSFAGSYAYASGATGTVDDSAIQTALGKLIDAGSVAKPDANTLYAIHFAPGINITMQGQGSCQVFCAYHGSFSHSGTNVYYSVVPDQGGSCAGGCGSDPSLFNNTTSVSSHELVEATTDADVGQNNLAWYDNTNGEIGDICNAQQGSICGYTVQAEWSNQSNACIVKKASTDGSCGGAGGGGGGGGGGAGGGGGGGGGAGGGGGGGGGAGGGGGGGGGAGGGGGGGGGGGTGGGGGGGGGIAAARTTRARPAARSTRRATAALAPSALRTPTAARPRGTRSASVKSARSAA